MKNANSKLQVKLDWFSVWQFALSTLAVFFLLSSAFGMVMLALTSLFEMDTGAEPLLFLMMAAGMIAAGLLVLPSAGYAFLRILGRQVERPENLSYGLKPIFVILLLPFTLLLGYLVIDVPTLSWLFIPTLHVLAIGLPVFCVLYLGIRDLPIGSAQRRWGVFSSGLVLGPMVILAMETLALIGFVILGAFIIADQPELIEELTNLVEWMSVSGPDPDVFLDRLGPYLTRPGVIYAVLAFGALIVPIIEEAFKPIGVWLLIGRNISPVEGFTAGALSGAGYALFESLAISTSSEDWIMLVVARVGTAMIHVLTTALMGWVLALAWGRNRYLNLGITYLGVILIHGIWNGLTLLNSFTLIAEELGVDASNIPLPGLASATPYILAVMAVTALLSLIVINRRFAKSSIKRATNVELQDSSDNSKKEQILPDSEPVQLNGLEGEALNDGGTD